MMGILGKFLKFVFMPTLSVFDILWLVPLIVATSTYTHWLLVLIVPMSMLSVKMQRIYSEA